MFLSRRSRLKVVPEGGAPARCPYCKDHFTLDDATTQCADCGVLSHVACWDQNRGCGVFGCHRDLWFFTSTRLTAPARTASFGDVLSGTSSWCATILGLAFLIFLPLTMASMLTLSAGEFHEWILTRNYLAGSLSLASVVGGAVLRSGLRDRAGRAGFVLACLLMILGVLCAGQIWTRAHLPY